MRALTAIVAILLASVSITAADTVTNENLQRWSGMSLEQLLNEPVVTPSRNAETLASSAAAIQVITSEDIQRSGAINLPEVLRLASNLEVARAGSSSWAISARGFNNTLANKMLVMIDGRSVYTPLYAGVFWDAQNVLLEDVDRIEVVSGPGGTLWGANAVNGVINVITKSAKDTQGVYVSSAAGTFLQDFAAMRYGGSITSNLFYRVYVQRFDYNDTRALGGAYSPDKWDMTQGGFRVDWEASELNTLTLQGDFYGGDEDMIAGHTSLDGQNVLGRWTHIFSLDSELQVQAYFDRTWRDIPNSFAEDLKTYDIDVQHRFPLGEIQSITWGLGYRFMQDRIDSGMILFLPENKNLELFSGFIQDEITLVPELWKLAIGTKLEHNEYSDFEFQPSIRLAWTPDTNHTVWAAVSRAVRSPSRIDTEVLTPPPPGTPSFFGDPDFDSEKLLAFELGFRCRPAKPVWFSVSTYYNYYEDLRSVDQVTPNNFVLENHFRGSVLGVETSVEYLPTDWWRLRGGYNYLNKNLWTHGGQNVAASIREGNDPEHQFSLYSMMNLPGNFRFDIGGRFVDSLSSPDVNSYFALDARLGWQYKNLDVSVVGQNLTDSYHAEFGTRQIPSGVYGMVTLRF